MIALIDGDVIVYGAAFRAQESVDWGDGELVSHANTSVAFADAHERVAEAVEAVEADRVIIALSDPGGCFRADYWPEYKQHRRWSQRPLAYGAVRTFLAEEYEVVQRPRLEGDDVLGILATGNIKGIPVDAPRVIVSIDKDMRTIPGLHWNPMRKDAGVVEVDAHEAELTFYRQVLTGDSTDGYPGCPGIGPVRAARIITPEMEAADLWPALVEEYERRALTEDDAIVQARCARILHACDYNFKTKEVIPWSPPKSESGGTPR